MWSDTYWYFNIQKDKSEYQLLDIKKITDVLLSTGCLKQVNKQTFKNKENFPWIDIVISNSINGNFSINSEQINEINLISIVCTKKDNNYDEPYKDLLLKIAFQLNWKLFLEEDDKGHQQLEINYPEQRFDYELDINPKQRFLTILNRIDDKELQSITLKELSLRFQDNNKAQEYFRIHQQEFFEFTSNRTNKKLFSFGISHSYANIELPKVYDIVFDIRDTSRFWKTKTIVRYAFNSRTFFHTDLWRGHHSHCYIEIVGDIPPIFDELTFDENRQLQIGLTTQYDWEFVEPFLKEIYKEK
jgi:hypothetical protein